MATNDLFDDDMNAAPVPPFPKLHEATAAELLESRNRPSHTAPETSSSLFSDEMPSWQMHPNEGEEPPVLLSDIHNPFSPFSEAFKLDLNEDDVVEPVIIVPGVQPQKSSNLQTPEDREEALKDMLSSAMDPGLKTRAIILEYGPLAPLEKRLRDITHDFADTDVAELISTRIRRCIHDSVVSNTLLGEKENSEAGLMARIEAVSDLNDSMQSEVEPILAKIEGMGLDMSTLRTAIFNTIEVEQRRLKCMSENMAPMTLGSQIFEGIKDLASSLKTGLGGKEELVGDIRRHRNNDLARQLGELVDVSAEINRRSGDEAWERTEGIMALNAASRLSSNIKGLTEGVEDQVDFSVLNKGLVEVKDNMAEANSVAATDDYKKHLEDMMAFINETVERISQAVKRAITTLTSGFTKGPPAPAP